MFHDELLLKPQHSSIKLEKVTPPLFINAWEKLHHPSVYVPLPSSWNWK